VRVATRTRARALAAYALVLAVVLGVLGLWVMTSESRHPAPFQPRSDPKDVDVAPPEDADIGPVEAAVSDTRTR
jgi:hypothetical protein